jgi:hypothetical protein
MGEVVTLVTGGSHPATPVNSDARKSGLEQIFCLSPQTFELPEPWLDAGRSPRTTREDGAFESIGTVRISLAANESGTPLRDGLAKFAEGICLKHFST